MADFIEIPKRWGLVAPDFTWGECSPKEAQKIRRNLINSEDAEVVGVLVWNFEVGKGDILIHPTHKPSTKFLENISQKDWITDCISLLEKHLAYINKLEDEAR